MSTWTWKILIIQVYTVTLILITSHHSSSTWSSTWSSGLLSFSNSPKLPVELQVASEENFEFEFEVGTQPLLDLTGGLGFRITGIQAGKF